MEFKPDCTITIDANNIVDYVCIAEYARAWPDKLVAYFREHCEDDESNDFVKGFWEYCKEADSDGPEIESWWKD